jgi:uncharacterized protein (DUF4415 family)
MAKKTSKSTNIKTKPTEAESTVTNNDNKETKKIVTENNKTNEELVTNPEYKKVECKDITTIDICDLIALEKACAIVCRKYETAARIDRDNMDKFREYGDYYQSIFHELERRVINIFKK